MQPLLVLNPRVDREFRARAEAALSKAKDDPLVLQRLLRVRYPYTSVDARNTATGVRPVWYVYRDGSWTFD